VTNGRHPHVFVISSPALSSLGSTSGEMPSPVRRRIFLVCSFAPVCSSCCSNKRDAGRGLFPYFTPLCTILHWRVSPEPFLPSY
jgi:hypothetical protein